MGKLFFFAIFVASVGKINCLECRVCTNAVSLDDCTETRICQQHEECYMEEIITTSSKIVFSGGCRSSAVCSATLNGKRALTDQLVACSRCCDEPEVKNSSVTLGKHFCNDNLCGLRPTPKINGSQLHECYECSDISVNEVNSCNHVTKCGYDEVCGAWANSHSGSVRYYMGCQPKNLCVAATKILIQANIMIGKREDTRLCNVCCGDSLCNTGLCIPLLKKLQTLYKGGHLDIDTLTYTP